MLNLSEHSAEQHQVQDMQMIPMLNESSRSRKPELTLRRQTLWECAEILCRTLTFP